LSKGRAVENIRDKESMAEVRREAITSLSIGI
jgi:hypothetical protein